MATLAASGNNGDRLSEVLLREGLLTREQLASAMAEMKASKHRLGYVLVKLGMVPELEITKVLARQSGCRRWISPASRSMPRSSS